MWLRCVDKALINATGAGLKKMQQPTELEERKQPLDWLGLSISCDQEAAGHHAVQAALRHLNLNVEYLPDPSHGGQRCVQDLLKKSNLWPYMQSMMITKNIPHGPWSEDMRFKQAQQIMVEHIFNTGSSECSMFQALAFNMLRDRCEEHLAGEDGTEENLWDSLLTDDVWRKRGCKGVINRFMGVIRELRGSDQDWSRLTYSYQLLGTELDFFKGKNVLNMLLPGSSADHAAEAAQASSSSASLSSGPGLRVPSAAERSVRASGCNAVVGGLAFLLQDNRQNIGRVILSVASSQDKWHGKQNIELRSCEGANK